MDSVDHCKDAGVLAERIAQLEKRVFEKFETERLFRSETKAALEARLESMNEFRDQLNRQASTFISRSELLAVATLIAAVVEILSHVLWK